MREGDRLFFAAKGSTKDTLVLLTNKGNMFGLQLFDLPSTSGFGEPVQKTFRFQDGEQIIACRLLGDNPECSELVFYTRKGYGFIYEVRSAWRHKEERKAHRALRLWRSCAGCL